MKRIRNQREYALTIAVDPPIEVGPGDTAEVDDDLAANLLEQPDNWGPAEPAPKTKSKDGEG